MRRRSSCGRDSRDAEGGEEEVEGEVVIIVSEDIVVGLVVYGGCGLSSKSSSVYGCRASLCTLLACSRIDRAEEQKRGRMKLSSAKEKGRGEDGGKVGPSPPSSWVIYARRLSMKSRLVAIGRWGANASTFEGKIAASWEIDVSARFMRDRGGVASDSNPILPFLRAQSSNHEKRRGRLGSVLWSSVVINSTTCHGWI